MRELQETTKQPIPERQMWAAALGLLLGDALAQANQGARKYKSKSAADDETSTYGRRHLSMLRREHADGALSDVLACGPMLRRLCDMLDLDAEAVSERFRSQLRPGNINREKRTSTS